MGSTTGDKGREGLPLPVLVRVGNFGKLKAKLFETVVPGEGFLELSCIRSLEVRGQPNPGDVVANVASFLDIPEDEPGEAEEE